MSELTNQPTKSWTAGVQIRKYSNLWVLKMFKMLKLRKFHKILWNSHEPLASKMNAATSSTRAGTDHSRPVVLYLKHVSLHINFETIFTLLA